MKISLGRIVDVSLARITRLVGDIERAFERIPEDVRRTYSASLNFSAPASVPGFTSLTVNIQGVEMGDTVVVGCSITAPAGFMPPIGFVSADGVVTVRWLQVTGAAANPDGAGATYTIDVFRH